MAGRSSVPKDSEKVDSLAANALTGVVDSLAYRVGEIERHHHSCEYWFGAAVSPATGNVADLITDKDVGVFQVDAGNDAFGVWVNILGADDTPVVAGKVKYDLHRIFIETVERAGVDYRVQIGYGDTGTAALAANDVTTFIFKVDTAAARSTPIVVQSARQDSGTLAWARILVPDQNTATMDFYIGLHEYEG